MYEQVIPFNQSKAGKKNMLCLQNVRLGFGIAPLYENAISAWKNTEQHKDRNIPLGVDVPLFYSWSVDGHINVRLANGTVWSDGKIFKNLEDYEAKSAPVYLGWGESVNGVRVIKKGQEMTTREEAIYLRRLIEFKHSPTEAEKKAWTGKELTPLLKSAYEDPKFQARKEAVAKYPVVSKQVEELTKAVQIKDNEIAKLKSQVGDSSKWETLKALVRELIGR